MNSEFRMHNASRRYEKPRPKRRRYSGNNDNFKEAKADTLKAIVVDSGAYTIKVGLSSDKQPNVIPNCIMKAKSERKRLFIGNQISECRDCSGLYYLLPCERGYVTKWDVQKPVWDYVFSKNVCPVNDHPVILTQPLFNFKSIQDCVDEIFFEEYEVNSMFRLNPTDLAKVKYTDEKRLSNDTPCVIVDSGFSFTHIIPYIQGNKYLKGIRRLNVGGKLLTNHLKDILSYRQYNVMEETYVINQVKEDTCYVAEDVTKELRTAEATRNNPIVKNYVLPDFNNIRRGYVEDPNNVDEKAENCQILRLNNERFVVPEILFHPSDIGMKSMGIAEAVVKSIYSCPGEYQESLAKNIVLIGGNCNFPGFKERMFAELRCQLPNLWKVSVYQPEDPISYSWMGGAPLLKTPDFKSLLVTKAEYEELGSIIIQQRFNHWMTNIREEEKEKPAQEDQEEQPSLLERIKGSTIFGKQNSNSSLESRISSVFLSDLSPSTSHVENEDSNHTSTNVVDEPTESVVSDETSLDDALQVNSEVGEASGKRTKAFVKHNKSKKTEDEVVDVDSQVEEDLTTSLELFPLGTGSYL